MDITEGDYEFKNETETHEYTNGCMYIRVNQFLKIRPQLQEQVHNLNLNNVYFNRFEIYCDLKMHGLVKVLEV